MPSSGARAARKRSTTSATVQPAASITRASCGSVAKWGGSNLAEGSRAQAAVRGRARVARALHPRPDLGYLQLAARRRERLRHLLVAHGA
mmetsp:Transcript_7349/g.21306  ORF Transcript_7349/g.21306 Transcript_7349/m.21306 type:complete len:90 (+) Transcript_7349:237-506(+)